MIKKSGKVSRQQRTTGATRGISRYWSKLEPLLSVYRGEKQYKHACKMLDHILAEIGEEENHPLSSLVETLGILIEEYENRNVEEIHSSPIAVIEYLIEEHNLTQSDLPEIGSQGVVSEVLSGKRELNKRQILALSKRFRISPLIFFGGTGTGRRLRAA